MGPIEQRIKAGAGAVAPEIDKIDKNDLRERIGTRLRFFRLRRNMTLAAVATATGIGASHLSRVESGQAGADIVHLLRLAQVYEVKVGELIS